MSTIPNKEVQISSSYPFAQAAERFETTTAGMVIRVDSDCYGRSRILASDLVTALEYGAGPGMHEIIIDRMQQAENEHRPLSCTMIYS